MKEIFTWGEGKRSKRNFTIYDLLNLKGKKKLSQVNCGNEIEVQAAVEANIDLLICLSTDVKMIRANAPQHFLTGAILEHEYYSKDDLLKASMHTLENGADAIYTSKNPHVVEYLAKESVPVMAHLGFIPVKSSWTGGIRGAAKTAKEAYKLYQQFKDMENAGAILVEAEVIAGDILTEISKRTNMVTVSLGSGNGGDVNYLFMCDICGENKDLPRHAIQYGNLNPFYQKIQKERVNALKKFNADAKKNNFAKQKNIVSITKKELNSFLKKI
jgi:3-methyl-2-oxobutanoate hydroxymethyltransferase